MPSQGSAAGEVLTIRPNSKNLSRISHGILGLIEDLNRKPQLTRDTITDITDNVVTLTTRPPRRHSLVEVELKGVQ